MVKLTEDMVIARSKTSDLGTITKLNFWGSDLTDISIVKLFKRAEILSFSLNMITSLSPFQYCKNLQELYIRRNDIRDLREVCYLQELPQLKRLLLSENPCCESTGDLYRPTVIRALPNLEMLDNEEISSVEREYALQLGLILEHPTRRREQEKIVPGTRYYEGPEPGRSPRYYDETLLRHRNTLLDTAGHSKISPSESCVSHSSTIPVSSRPATVANAPSYVPTCAVPGNDSGGNHHDPACPSSRTNYSCPQSNRTSAPNSSRTSASPILEFYRQGCEKHGAQRNHGESNIIRLQNNNHLVDDFSLNHTFSPSAVSSSATAKSSKNIVSAVICLINELDIGGLELVEIALKRRQNELSYS